MQEAEKVHREAIVIDGHADTPQRFVDEGWNFTDDLGTGMVSLQAARAGGLTAQFFAAWVEPHEWRGRYIERTLSLIDSVYEQARRSCGTMRVGTTAADIERAKADGVFCALLGIEGGHSIDAGDEAASLALLRMYARLGVRYMTLTWTNTNAWADSSGDLDDASIAHHGGLTGFGRRIIAEMNRLGMMVDASHASDETFWQVLDCSRAPIIASHSSARSLTNALRNLTDDQLRALAAKGGLAMVNFYAPFVDEEFRVAWKSLEHERKPLYEEADRPYRERNIPAPYSASLAIDRAFYRDNVGKRLPLPRFESLIDHFDHMVKVAGIEHVGVGSDFEGFALLPEGIRSAADLPKITAALMDRGYTAEQMKLLLGGNLLRVMRAVEAARQTE